jgi:outer membrane protein TolC
MNKITFVFLGLSLTAFGMSYTQFKKHTLKHAKALQSQALDLRKTQAQNVLTLRTPNPVLAVELGRYDSKFQSPNYGYSIVASQKIRTSSYLNTLTQSTDAQSALVQLLVIQGKATYIKTLETFYTNYVYQSKMLTLLQEEIKLSKKMTSVAKERYVSGSETKVTYLQAKTQSLSLQTELHGIRIQRDSLYYQLLAMGGYKQKVALSKKFIYPIKSYKKSNSNVNIQEQILQAKNRLYASQLAQKSETFTSYDITAGLEKEPEQSILRVGISIPLPVQHNKEEEKTLAKLKMQQLNLDQEQLMLNNHMDKKMLKSVITERTQQYQALKVLTKEQQSLTNLLAEGYKIAQGSLFELMLSKNRLIQTKKQLLQTQKDINIQTIELRYLQGAYND